MSGFTLAICEAAWNELTRALSRREESGAVLGARLVEESGGPILLVRSVSWIPDAAYERREPHELVISSDGWFPALRPVAEDHSVAIFVHTHPRAPARLSPKDRAVSSALEGPFRSRTGQPIFAHVVIGGSEQSPDVGGELLRIGDDPVPLRCVRIAGSRLRVVLPKESGAGVVPVAFDRHARAFGKDGQRLLGMLRIGVVGCGGTGSAVIDQLARLGVGQLTVIDPKALTEGNLTRVHGSTLVDVGRPKADVLADHVRRVGLGTEVKPITGSVVTEEVARVLCACDVVFGCTDDNAGRAVLSRLAYFVLTPLIDLGVVVDVPSERVAGVYGRVTLCGPGSACLGCRGRIDWARADAEALDPAERERLAGEGYVVGLGEPDPSVVAFTTLVASLAVSELLSGLFGYGRGDPPGEILALVHGRRLSTNSAGSRDGCYCADPLYLGAGDGAPFLDRLWT